MPTLVRIMMIVRSARARILTFVGVGSLVLCAIWVTGRTLRPSHHRDSHEHARHSAVRADLRNLVASQEIHYDEHGTYASRLEQLVDFRVSEGTRLELNTAADGATWSAEAGHELADSAFLCMVQVGFADGRGVDRRGRRLYWVEGPTGRRFDRLEPGRPACTEW